MPRRANTVARFRVEQGAKADSGGVLLSPLGPDTRTFISTFCFTCATSVSDQSSRNCVALAVALIFDPNDPTFAPRICDHLDAQ
jgi:hypothetical protein